MTGAARVSATIAPARFGQPALDCITQTQAALNAYTPRRKAVPNRPLPSSQPLLERDDTLGSMERLEAGQYYGACSQMPEDR